MCWRCDRTCISGNHVDCQSVSSVTMFIIKVTLYSAWAKFKVCNELIYAYYLRVQQKKFLKFKEKLSKQTHIHIQKIQFSNLINNNVRKCLQKGQIVYTIQQRMLGKLKYVLGIADLIHQFLCSDLRNCRPPIAQKGFGN